MSNESTTEPILVITILYRELAVLATFLVATIGAYCHWFILICILRGLTQISPFFLFIASQSLAEAILLTFFVFYYPPMVLYNISQMKINSHIMGTITMICLDVTNASHLVMALNRLCAICAPTKYTKYFSKQSSWVFIALIWSTSIIDHAIVEGVLGCTYHYSDSAWGFTFKFGKDCDLVLYSTNTIKQFCMVGAIGLIDTVTLVKLRLTSKKVSATWGKILKFDIQFSTAQAVASRKADINFFKQALLQFLIWIVEMVCYFFVSNFFTHVFIKWILMNLAWLIMHSADGISLLALNQEFKKLFWSPIKVCKKSKKSSVKIDAIPVSTAVPSRAHQTERGFKIEFSHNEHGILE